MNEVCRYSVDLLVGLKDWVIPLLGLAVALFIYRLQKQADRDAELRREQRVSYREFLEVIIAVTNSISKVNFDSSEPNIFSPIFVARRKFQDASRLLALTASKEVFNELKEMEKVIERVLARLSEELSNIIQEMREEPTGEISNDEFLRRIDPVLQRGKEEIFKTENTIRNKMRMEEFGGKTAPR